MVVQVCGRRIMANIRAFQACDESSILSARTKEKSRVNDTAFFFLVTNS